MKKYLKKMIAACVIGAMLLSTVGCALHSSYTTVTGKAGGRYCDRAGEKYGIYGIHGDIQFQQPAVDSGLDFGNGFPTVDAKDTKMELTISVPFVFNDPNKPQGGGGGITQKNIPVPPCGSGQGNNTLYPLQVFPNPDGTVYFATQYYDKLYEVIYDTVSTPDYYGRNSSSKYEKISFHDYYNNYPMEVIPYDDGFWMMTTGETPDDYKTFEKKEEHITTAYLSKVMVADDGTITTKDVEISGFNFLYPDGWDGTNWTHHLLEDNGIIYIVEWDSYKEPSPGEFLVWTYDVAADTVTGPTSLDFSGYRVVFKEGCLVEDGKLYARQIAEDPMSGVFHYGYTSEGSLKGSNKMLLSGLYADVGLVSYDFASGQYEECSDFGTYEACIYSLGHGNMSAEDEGKAPQSYQTDESTLQHLEPFMFPMMKSEKGIFLMTMNGILFRERGTNTVTTALDRFADNWNVAGDWIFYRDETDDDCTSIFAHNYVTGEDLTYDISEALTNETIIQSFGDTTDDWDFIFKKTHYIVANVSNDRVVYFYPRFGSIKASEGIASITFNDDGTITVKSGLQN